MRYIPHTDDDVRGMLDAIGAKSVDALFACVPEKLRLRAALALPAAASEQEVLGELADLAARNAHAGAQAWFLGAGTYAHFIPSAVDALASRGEFTTSYTPYQAEISQGTLQAIFEWQTMMAGLTGLEVSNASMYDGASATAEAALMALRLTRRSKVAVSAALHPHYRAVLDTYLRGLDAGVVEIPRTPAGTTAPAALDADTACVVLQQPNFLGALEDLSAAAEAAHAAGALLVGVTSEALSLALLRAPGASGADIACGEAQSFGVPMGFGGPHLGFLCTRAHFVRQMPGRLVGATEDARGRRGFVLTLSTREQHIRRERATSNICTNQGLCLLMATIYLALLGRRGLRRLAEINLAKAAYARERLREARLRPLFAGPCFNEFAVATRGSAESALARARDAGVVAGLDLAPHAPELGPALLVCATELASRAQIDRLAEVLA
jgi:glycine cleavage system P protein (glycine dehydrogenase) subunit 1